MPSERLDKPLQLEIRAHPRFVAVRSRITLREPFVNDHARPEVLREQEHTRVPVSVERFGAVQPRLAGA